MAVSPVHPKGCHNGKAILRGTVNAPEFPAGMDWLNVDHPLSIRDLQGKLVLLDFWTYC